MGESGADLWIKETSVYQADKVWSCMASFNYQFDTVLNHLKRVSVRDCLDQVGLGEPVLVILTEESRPFLCGQHHSLSRRFCTIRNKERAEHE